MRVSVGPLRHRAVGSQGAGRCLGLRTSTSTADGKAISIFARASKLTRTPVARTCSGHARADAQHLLLSTPYKSRREQHPVCLTKAKAGLAGGCCGTVTKLLSSPPTPVLSLSRIVRTCCCLVVYFDPHRGAEGAASYHAVMSERDVGRVCTKHEIYPHRGGREGGVRAYQLFSMRGRGRITASSMVPCQRGFVPTRNGSAASRLPQDDYNDKSNAAQ